METTNSILSYWDYGIIVLYFALTLWIGLRYAARANKDMDSFFLGGRGLSWLLAGVSMVATTFAADTPLAVNELVVKNGISGNWLWWNFLAGGMLTTFFFANLWRRSGVLTEVELIELRYSGKAAAFLRGFKAVYLGLFLNMLVLAWVNVAMVKILQGFFGLSGDAALLYTAAAMLFVAVYSSLSGLLGVAMTDAVQFVIAMFGCIVLAYLVVNSPQIGGIDGLQTQLLQLQPSALSFFPTIGEGGAQLGTTLAISISTFVAHIAFQWWASWYPGAEPGGGGYVAQRMMSTKSEKDAVYATLFFQIAHYCIRPWPWILVGLSCIILYPNLKDPQMGYILAMKDFLPDGIRGLLLVAFFAAYMSTIATQLNWGASYLVNDLYHRFVNPKANDQELLWAARIATVLLMAVGLGVSTQIQSIAGVWAFLIECGAGLGSVLILRWYWWRINAWSEIAATVAPLVVFGTIKILSIYYPDHAYLSFPNSYFITIGATVLTWVVVTFLTPPTDTATLLRFYEKVRPDGAWKPIQAQSKTHKSRASQLGSLLVCWLSAVAMTYSLLFGLGSLIFKHYGTAAIWAAVALVSFVVLRSMLSRTSVLGD